MAQLRETVEFIKGKVSLSPQLGIILGTGLGNLVDEIDITNTLDYEVIPNMHPSTVESHTGRLIFGSLGDKQVVAMQGRYHFYEGYSMKEVTFPVRVLKMLGIDHLFISNAAGGLNTAMEEGDLMIISDHINLHHENPLTGENLDELGPRFPDMSEPYDRELVSRGLEIARAKGIRCSAGVYVSVPGPNLETIAEYKYLHGIGADAVGMSTVPEVIVATHMGLPVFAISVITDIGYPPERVQKVSVEKIIAIAGEAEPNMTEVMKEVITSF